MTKIIEKKNMCLEQEGEVRKGLVHGIYSLLREDLDGNSLKYLYLKRECYYDKSCGTDSTLQKTWG